MDASYLGDWGDEATLVARGRTSVRPSTLGIARRSCGRRRTEAAVVELVDLASKQAPKGVKTEEQGEGENLGCRGEARVAGVGRGVRVLPAAGGGDASSRSGSLTAGLLG